MSNATAGNAAPPDFKKELEQIRKCEFMNDRKCSPVSSSYLRENLYQPLTKKFTLAWENIYKLLYEPNVNDTFKRKIEPSDEKIPFISIDKAIKPLPVLDIYSKGLNSFQSAGDEIYMNAISYLPTEKNQKGKKNLFQVNKISSARKPTFTLDKVRETLLDSVGIIYDREKDKFISKSKYLSMSPVRENREIADQLSGRSMPFRTRTLIGRKANPSLTSLKKESVDSISCPATQMIKRTSIKESSSKLINFFSPESNSELNSDVILEEAPQNDKKDSNFEVKPFKIIPIYTPERAPSIVKTPQTERKYTFHNIDHFMEQVDKNKKLGNRCLSSCISTSRRLASKYKNISESINRKDTDFSKRDKAVMLKEYLQEKNAFLYGKHGLGHFVTASGVDYMKKSDLIAKTNPKYKFLLKKLNFYNKD